MDSNKTVLQCQDDLPMRWHKFNLYFRMPLTALVSFGSTISMIQSLTDAVNSPFIVIILLLEFLQAGLCIFSVCAFVRGRKFNENGYRAIYSWIVYYMICNIGFSFTGLGLTWINIDAPPTMLNGILFLLIGYCELRYYKRRKLMFTPHVDSPEVQEPSKRNMYINKQLSKIVQKEPLKENLSVQRHADRIHIRAYEKHEENVIEFVNTEPKAVEKMPPTTASAPLHKLPIDFTKELDQMTDSDKKDLLEFIQIKKNQRHQEEENTIQ